MIKVDKTKDLIIISGHAGYDEQGKDIICAGISTLVYTFIYSVQDLTDDEITYDINDGISIIKIKDLTKNSQILLSSFIYGCRLIADNYPDYVQVSEH